MDLFIVLFFVICIGLIHANPVEKSGHLVKPNKYQAGLLNTDTADTEKRGRIVRSLNYQVECCLCNDFDANPLNDCNEDRCLKDLYNAERILTANCEYCQYTKQYTGTTWKSQVQCSVQPLCERDYARTLATEGCFGSGAPMKDTTCYYCCRSPMLFSPIDYCIKETLNGYSKFDKYPGITAAPALTTTTTPTTTTTTTPTTTTTTPTTTTTTPTTTTTTPTTTTTTPTITTPTTTTPTTTTTTTTTPTTTTTTPTTTTTTPTTTTTTPTTTTTTTTTTTPTTTTTTPTSTTTTPTTTTTTPTTTTTTPTTTTTTTTTTSSLTTKPSHIQQGCSECNNLDGKNCNDNTEPCSDQCQNRLIFTKSGHLRRVSKSCVLDIECTENTRKNDIIRCSPYMLNRTSSIGIVCTYCCDPAVSNTPCNMELFTLSHRTTGLIHASPVDKSLHLVKPNKSEAGLLNTDTADTEKKGRIVRSLNYQVECCLCNDFDDSPLNDCNEDRCLKDLINSERILTASCEYCQYTKQYTGTTWKSQVQCSVQPLCEHDYARTLATEGCFGSGAPMKDTTCYYCCRSPTFFSPIDYCINDTLHGYSKFDKYPGITADPALTATTTPTTTTTTPTTTTPTTTITTPTTTTTTTTPTTTTTTPTTTTTTTTPTTTTTTPTTTMTTTSPIPTTTTATTTISSLTTKPSQIQQGCSECNNLDGNNCNDNTEPCSGQCQNRLTFTKSGHLRRVSKSCVLDIECSENARENDIIWCNPYTLNRTSPTGIVCTYCCDPKLSSTPCNMELFTRSHRTTASVTALVTASVSSNVTASVSSNVTARIPSNVTASGPSNVTANVTASVSSNVTASVSSNVTASVSSNVTASVSSNVTASIPSNVTASVPSHVTASVTANVTASVSSNVTASVSSNVTASVSSNVTASIPSNVTASVSSNVTASVSSNVTASVSSNVTASVSSNVTASVSSNVTASVSSNVTASVSYNVTASIPSNVTASVSSNVTASVSSNVTASVPSNVTASVSSNVTASVSSNVTASVPLNVTASVSSNVTASVYSNVTASVSSSVTANVTKGITSGPSTTQSTITSKTTVKTTNKSPTRSWHQKLGSTICMACLDTEENCDQLYAETTCTEPNNYCINFMKNSESGITTVNRTCGDINRCYREWFQGSSDNDKCQQFRDGDVITVEFECTYCCIKDRCNEKISPDIDTLYNDV